MAIKRINTSGLSGARYNNMHAGNTTIPDVPDAPSAVSLSSSSIISDITASVSFTPSQTGGTPTLFRAKSNPGDIEATSATSPIVLTGLLANTSYTFTVRAENATGNSAYSSASPGSTLYTAVSSVSENFNRILANLNNQSASDGVSTWTVLRGAWSTNGTQATSSDTNSSTAVVNVSSSTITNAQVDIPDGQGGVGLAFWVSSANSIWAAYPYYSFSSSTTYNCSNTTISSSCNGCDSYCVQNSAPSVNCTCCDGNSITVHNTYGISKCNTYCSSLGGLCDYIFYTAYTVRYQTSSTTNTYSSGLRVDYWNGTSLSNQLHHNWSVSSGGFSPAYSIAISTSGNTISYSAYSGSNKTGSQLLNSSFTPTSPVKGFRMGIFKTVSANNQGSLLDNFSGTTA